MQHIVCVYCQAEMSGKDINAPCSAAHRLTLLILLPERKYGRWPNTEAYYWWSQWEGSVSKPLYKPMRKNTHTHKSTSAGMPRFLTQPSGGDFPFHQLFSSSSSNQNQLKDGDLICCHSSPLPDLDDRRVSELPQSWRKNQAGRENSSEDSPLSRKGNH